MLDSSEVERIVAAINKAWIDRYGGESVTAIAALENRVHKIAEDRDCWVQNAKAVQKEYLILISLRKRQ